MSLKRRVKKLETLARARSEQTPEAIMFEWVGLLDMAFSYGEAFEQSVASFGGAGSHITPRDYARSPEIRRRIQKEVKRFRDERCREVDT